MGESHPVRPGEVTTIRDDARPRCVATTATRGAGVPVVLLGLVAGVDNVSELNFPAGRICATVTGNLSNMEDPAAIHEMAPACEARPRAGAGWQT
jgi:hypothetical protein